MTEREACIALNLVPGIGFVKFSALGNALGSVAEVNHASIEDLYKIRGIGEVLAEKLATFEWELELDRECDLADRAGVRILTLFDEGYPAVLRELHDPPLCLYVRGHLPKFPDNAIAVVGTRRMSAYGGRMTEQLTAEAVAAGFVIVSGLAFGVDTVAHRVAVNSGGVTIAVLGGGLLNIQPSENIPLARDIVAHGGAIISEFPLRFPVSRTSFPRRNRIVAGLCQATLVVEAGLKSGALITAKMALENGREVLAVPGHADNPQAQGCHLLIKEGAGLVENFDDVAQTLGLGLLSGLGVQTNISDVEYKPDSKNDLPVELQKILDVLKSGDFTFDELREFCNFDSGVLAGILMRLEMMLLIERQPDQRYNLIRR